MADDVPLTGPSTEGNRLRLRKSTTGMLVVESALRSRGGGRPVTAASSRRAARRDGYPLCGLFSRVGPRADSVQAALREGGPTISPPGHLPFSSGACRPRVRRACAGAGAPVALNEVRKRLKRVDRGSAQGVHRTDRGCPLGLPGDAPGWPPVAGMPPVAEAGRGRGRGAAHHARGAARHAGTSRPVAQGTFTARAPSRPRDLHGQGEKTLEPDPVVR